MNRSTRVVGAALSFLIAPLALALAGLERLGRRTVHEVEVHRATGDGGATGHGVTDAGDAVVAVLEGTGRPGLATGAGVHSLLRG